MIDSGKGILSSTTREIANYQHGAFHMAQNPAMFEPIRTNNFEFIVDDIDDITEASYEGVVDGDGLSLPQHYLRMSVVSSSVPHFSQNAIEIKKGNSTIYFAGTPTFDAGQIVINDLIGANTQAILMAWQNLSYNVVTDKVGLAIDYKKKCTLIEYTPDQQPVRAWAMYGCWISGLSEGGDNAESNDKKQITATIRYDKAELIPMGKPSPDSYGRV